MSTTSTHLALPEAAHSWLRKMQVAYVPGPGTALLERFSQELLNHLRQQDHILQPQPQEGVDAILTTAAFGQPLNWRDSLMFTARRRFQLKQAPTVFTLLHATPSEFEGLLEHFERALQKDPPDPADFDFPGLAPKAYLTLYEQGRRGGPILSLVRLLQSQTMCVRIILVIGQDRPLEAYTFDLVGAHPRTDASDPNRFYEDLALRITTAVSTQEITHHQETGYPVPHCVWRELTTPAAMRAAGLELGKRNFFTEMVRVANLVNAPAIHESVSSQYSEGCFATWEPKLDALIATITGSARPVEKDNLTEDELSVIVGVRPDGMGALVRRVLGKRNDSPSSEAVEMMAMDAPLPRIRLGAPWETSAKVPVARSKLHGHRGVRAYDPSLVEHVYLDPSYYHYPVSCSTEAQAHAIVAAFSRSEALNNPDDPRQVVFTVLPGHGIVVVEKWVAGKRPFQIIWEFMDSGQLEIDNLVPQGPLNFVPQGASRLILEAE